MLTVPRNQARPTAIGSYRTAFSSASTRQQALRLSSFWAGTKRPGYNCSPTSSMKEQVGRLKTQRRRYIWHHYSGDSSNQLKIGVRHSIVLSPNHSTLLKKISGCLPISWALWATRSHRTSVRLIKTKQTGYSRDARCSNIQERSMLPA